MLHWMGRLSSDEKSKKVSAEAAPIHLIFTQSRIGDPSSICTSPCLNTLVFHVISKSEKGGSSAKAEKSVLI